MGQTRQLKKLDFILRTITNKEAKLIDRGITKYVYIEDVVEFIDSVKDKPIYMVELERFPREIPNDVAEDLYKYKQDKVFDKYFIVYTDYTDPKNLSEEAKKARNPDPILFGAFVEEGAREKYICSRLYFLADWIDPFCDLTLTKMVKEMADKGKDIQHELNIPITDEELSAKMNALLSPDDRLNGVRPIDLSNIILSSNSDTPPQPEEFYENKKLMKPNIFTKISTVFKVAGHYLLLTT